MDPGAWAAYGQHYQRLGAGGVNPSASALAQSGQLNDLSLSASLPRQDAIGGYGGAGPPPLLLSHHGLNVGQGGHHGDPSAASFVNSAGLLAPGYDQMITSFQNASAKGHLPPLNVSHGAAGLYKAMSAKEPEIGDLRGGFVRRGMGPTTMSSDPNMGMGSSAGLFNPQTPPPPPPHSWRHSNMVPTATSSPFGVLPHEAVMPRGSGGADPMDKLHSQDHRTKSSRMVMDTRSYMEQDLAAAHGYRNVSNAAARGSLMMQQEPLGPTAEALGLTGLKSSEYALYSNSNVAAARGLLAQNYISHTQAHFQPPELQSDKRELYEMPLIGAPQDKIEGYGGASSGGGGATGGGQGKSHFEMISNAQSHSGNASTMHGTSNHSRGSQRGSSAAHSREICTTQSQSRSTAHSSTYGNYANTSTVPTYSQSYHSPSPSHSIHSPAHYSPAAVDFSSSLSSHGGPPTPVSTPHYPHSTSVLSHNDSPGVIYSSVITRANVPVSASGTYSLASTMTPPHKPKHLNETKIATPTPPPLHRAYEPSVIGTAQITSDNCMTDMVASNHGIATNLSRMLPTPSRVGSDNGSNSGSNLTPLDHRMMQSPHTMASSGRLAADSCTQSPKTMGMDNVFNPQQMTLQDLAEMSSSNDKLDLETTGVGLLHPLKDSLVHHHEEPHLMDLSQPPPPPPTQQQQHLGVGVMHNMDGSGVDQTEQKPKKKRTHRSKKKQLAEEAAAAAAAMQSVSTSMQSVATNGNIQQPPPLIPPSPSSSASHQHHHHHHHHHHQQQQQHHSQMPMMRPGVGISPNDHSSSMSVPQSPLCSPVQQMYSPPSNHGPPSNTNHNLVNHGGPQHHSNHGMPNHHGGPSNHGPPQPPPCNEPYQVIQSNINYHHHHHHQQQQQQQQHHHLGNDSRTSFCNELPPQSSGQMGIGVGGSNQQGQQPLPPHNMIGVQPPSTNDISSTPSSLSSFDAMNFDPVVASDNKQQHPLAMEGEFHQEFPPPKFVRKTLSIEDDLGFLTELPPVCNVASDLKKNTCGGSTSSAPSGPPPGGNFLDSFLKFLKTDDPTSNVAASSSSIPIMTKPGRGRGAKSRETYTSPPQGRNVELNPVTGLFTCTDKPRGGASGRGRGSGTRKIPGPNAGRKLKYNSKYEAGTSFTNRNMVVPGPDAFTFSSEDDDDVMGSKGFVDSVNSALKSLTDQSGSYRGNNNGVNNNSTSTDSTTDHYAFPGNDVPPSTEPRFFSTLTKPNEKQNSTKSYLKSPPSKSIEGNKNVSHSSSSSSLASNQNQDLSASNYDSIGREYGSMMMMSPSIRKTKEKVNKKDKTKEKSNESCEKQGGDGNDSASSSSPVSLAKKPKLDSLDVEPPWSTAARMDTTLKHLPRSSNDDSNHLNSLGLRGRRRGRGGLHITALPRSYPNKRQKSMEETNAESFDQCDAVRKRGRPKMKDATLSSLDCLENASGFRAGDFIILSSDKSQANAPIWRIDGRSLLQKFEPYKDGNKTLYKGLSSYSRFCLGSKALYEPIVVQVVKSGHTNVVVEYLKDYQSKSFASSLSGLETDEASAHKENFEVYLQTLISQALDPNFISEIVKENDEYFLSHVHEIDEIVAYKKSQLSRCIQWDIILKDNVETFPFVMVRPFTAEGGQQMNCQACAKGFVSLRKVAFDGQLYNYTTLCPSKESCLKNMERRDFLLCANCTDVVQAYSQMHHQKYNLFTMCANKVNSIKSSDPTQESHVVLEHCLQDSTWINKLFGKIKSIWTNCSMLCR